MLKYGLIMKERPVALVHSYLSGRENPGVPDKLSRTGLLAAAELYRRGKIEKICIAVEPNLADMLAKRLRVLLQDKLRDEDLVVRPNGFTTVQEIRTFVKTAKKEGWGNLTAIGNNAHAPRIRRIASRYQEKMSVQSARGILVLFPRYDDLVNKMLNFPEQLSLDRQEKIANKIAAIPVIGHIATDLIPQIVPGKVALQLWVFKKIEADLRKS